MWLWLLACASKPADPEATTVAIESCDAPQQWYVDADDDGFGAAGGTPTEACEAIAGYAANDRDCDDDDAGRFPGNDDPCDGVDNNCDGIEDPTESRGFRDADGDGAGDITAPLEVCDTVTPAAPNGWDCDDTDPRLPVFVAPTTSAGTGTLAAPFASLDDALHTDAGCIRVLPGTYRTAVTFRGRDVDVASTDGPEVTVLEGDADDAVITIWGGETRATILSGFTIRNGGGRSTYEEWADGDDVFGADIRYGGGVVVTGASPTLRNLSVVDNHLPDSTRDDSTIPIHLTQSEGAGLFLEDGSPLVEDVVLERNRSTYGAAMYVGFDADVTMHRARIAENHAESGVIYVAWGALTATNLLLDANLSELPYDGLLTFYGTLDLANSTVVDQNVGLTTWGASEHRVTNSIFYGNDVGVADDGVVESTWLLSHNDVYGNADDSTPVADDAPVGADPLFVAYIADGLPNDDITLQSTSPCRDAGDPALTDPDGTRSDVGVTGGPFAL